MMGISRENAYDVLAKASRELMMWTFEIMTPLAKGFEIYQWINHIKFSSEEFTYALL